MTEGWICSYRAIWEHHLFGGDAQRVGVWTWLLHKAVWKETRFNNAGSTITLKRGQLCVSQRQIARETGMSHQQVRTFLADLETENAITQDTTHGRTVITICKYEHYQDKSDRKKPDSNTAATQQQHTKEQVNNIPVGEADKSAPSSVVNFASVQSAVWSIGVAYLSGHGVKNPRAIIGKMLKENSAAEILGAIDAAEKAETQDPVPYITKVLKPKPKDFRDLSPREQMLRII